MKSPGISFVNVDVPENTYVTCQTDLFIKYAPCKKIGVTGSKGKTTTSTLTYKMLCAGGVDFTEISTQMESMKCPGLYFSGEVIDVDGKCGGYNLQWAWASGMLAGNLL